MSVLYLTSIDLKQKLKENLISYWNEHHSLFDSANIGDYYVAKTIAETILSIFSDQPIYKPLNQEIGDTVEYLTQYIHSGYHQSDSTPLLYFVFHCSNSL